MNSTYRTLLIVLIALAELFALASSLAIPIDRIYPGIYLTGAARMVYEIAVVAFVIVGIVVPQTDPAVRAAAVPHPPLNYRSSRFREVKASLRYMTPLMWLLLCGIPAVDLAITLWFRASGQPLEGLNLGIVGGVLGVGFGYCAALCYSRLRALDEQTDQDRAGGHE